jgi:phosphoribosylanthranilate isomerase
MWQGKFVIWRFHRYWVTDMTKVKICGITTYEDALFCIEAGADMLGFNFYPLSTRYLPPPDCALIVARLRAHTRSALMVGVFVNAPLPEMLRIMERCSLDNAQLSGDEPADCLAAFEGRAFKALRPQRLENAFVEAEAYARPGVPPALLVDAAVPGAYGGTGQSGDWEIARALAHHDPLLLAGGLNPGNVRQAIETVHPWGVDVASGVEASPGRKDPQKVIAFLQAVRAQDANQIIAWKDSR